jgi:tetraacyldisaccharide 4'-kinase
MLSPVGAVYGAIAGSRMARPGRDAGIPVVCIGNLTLGGAGKTPAAILAAQILKGEGRKPFVLSRGYGGTLAGPLRVDPASHRAADVGDEPLLLARSVPVIVARDRVAGAEAARAAGADVVIMDDGFQNPSLQKNLSIVVVDGRRGVGNGSVFPAGPLRAPLDVQLGHAHAVLVMGEPVEARPMLARAFARKLPLFHGALEPDQAALAEIQRRPVLAFAGIGDPDKFFSTLSVAGVDVKVRMAFPDHHRFSRSEALALVERARRDGLLPVTTEKDMARLAGDADAAELAAVSQALPVRLVVAEESAFRDLLLRTR